MSIDTTKVSGRRTLRFQTLEQMLSDAETLARGPVRTLGNWSFGQILDHLAQWLEFPLEGFPITIPWYIRWPVWPFKGYLIRSAMRPGFRWSEREARIVTPQREVATEEGLARLRKVIARWRSETPKYPSPLLGHLTPVQWEQFQLRHAEHHLSYAVPG